METNDLTGKELQQVWDSLTPEQKENTWYRFTDQYGNEHVSRGDNWYVQESIETGLPIYVTNKGEWFVNPFLEQTSTGVKAHIPSWFKQTDEYNDWEKTWVPQIRTMGVTQDNVNSIKDILAGLGRQGATRLQTYKEVENYGITDESLKRRAFDEYKQLGIEANGGDKAQYNFSTLLKNEKDMSAADVARAFKEMSAEDRSRRLEGLQNILERKGAGAAVDDDTRIDALTITRILYAVNNDPDSFGENGEFKGLLEASEWQKFQNWLASFSDMIGQNAPVFNLFARLFSGIGYQIAGWSSGKTDKWNFGEGWSSPEKTSPYYSGENNARLGLNLQGWEGSAVAGKWTGVAVNMAATVVMSKLTGRFLNLKFSAKDPGSIFAKIGNFSQTLGGSMVFDFFTHDLPLDLSMFATDLGSKDLAKAWEDPENTQPLFGLWGPEVPGGLKYNLLGDVILDIGLPIMGILGGTAWDALDNATGGNLNRIRDKVALKNLKFQKKMSELPGIGKVLRGFTNVMMDSGDAFMMRKARERAILEGSMKYYTDAQNIITLKNHYGAEVVAPMYAKLCEELGINESIKKFKDNADNFGGFAEHKIPAMAAKNGVAKDLSETIVDDLPMDVRRGLQDYERLGELKGEAANEGGLIANPKRAAEIEELEKRVEALDPEIKDFAERFSELNKRVEQMTVGLGLTTQDWIDALNADPRWQNYMVRQIALPKGESSGTGAIDVTKNKLLSGSRTDWEYNPDKLLTPTMALDLKVHAIGTAYAWNERAKFMVESELVAGGVKAGEKAVELAKQIQEKRQFIMLQEDARVKLGFDMIVNGYSNKMKGFGDAVNTLNEKMSALENVAAKSVFSNQNLGGQSPEIKGFVSDFGTGKVSFADGAVTDISASDAASIVQNTYRLDGNVGHGMTASGAPYKFEVENGKITSVTKITDPVELSESVSGMGMGYKLSEAEARTIGPDNVAAVNRMQMFYKNNGLALPDKDTNIVTYYKQTKRNGAEEFGLSQGCPTMRFEDGKVVADYKFGVNNKFYSESGQADLKKQLADAANERWHPKNSTTPDRTFIHENGHTLMVQLTVSEFNDDLAKRLADMTPAQRKAYLKDVEVQATEKANVKFRKSSLSPERQPSQLEYDIYNKHRELEKELFDETLRKLGVANTPANRQAELAFSKYAKTRKSLESMRSEAIAEAMTDYAANGADASRFSIALVSLVQERMYKYRGVVNPAESLAENGIEVPKGLLRNGQYNFPKWKDTEDVTETNIVIPRPLLGQNEVKPFSQKMFHGSGKEASEIYVGAQVPVLGNGKYWAFKWTDAANFGDNLESAVISLKNPLTISSADDWRELTKQAGWAYPNPIGASEDVVRRDTENLRKLVIDSGYDGIIVKIDPNTDPDMLLRRVFGQDQVVDYGVDVKTKTTVLSRGESIDRQKAKWFEDWRYKNPYLKLGGDWDEETFRKANLWDSYFGKEMSMADPTYRGGGAPDELGELSGKYVEKMKADNAAQIVDNLKKLMPDGMDQELAMIAMGRNGADIAKATDDYIIRQMENSAREMAKNMEGGLTDDNFNTALITLWSSPETKEATKNMLRSLVPEGGLDIESKIENLFDTQAKGLEAYDALPLDTKAMIAEKNKLVNQLYQENKKTMKLGEEMDKNSPFRNNGTHIIHYKEGGEDVYVAVDDPVVASVLQKPYNFKENGIMGSTPQAIMNTIATLYRTGTTSANPIALIRNVLRDPIQAMVTGGFNPLTMNFSPEVFYKTLRQFGLDDNTIDLVTTRIHAYAASGTMTEEMRLVKGNNRLSGGAIDRMNTKLRGITNTKVINAAQMPLEQWEGFFRNQIGQQSFIRNFKKSGDVDNALSRALFDTSNVTTNFSHVIGKFRWATSTVPYLSSAINGSYSFWRLFNLDPIGMTARITAGFMVPIMAITAWNLSSEENRETYENLDGWFKDGHIVIVNPSGGVLAFPIPDEIANYAGVARRLMEYTQDANPASIPSILAQGAFGFAPASVGGYFRDDGTFDFVRGTGQLLSGIMPQVFTTTYELLWQQDLFTGQDLSGYDWINKTFNTLCNVLGSGFKNAINSLGMLFGASEDDLIGLSYQNTIARDLFGMGFHAARNQFMEIVGKPAKLDENGNMTKASGLFKENEELKAKIKALDSKIATSSDEDKAALEQQKQDLIDNFTNKVSNAMDKYQRMFSVTGGLEAWQKNRLIQLLTLGDGYSSASSDSYQSADASQAFLNERSLGIQRYNQLGLPAGPTQDDILSGDNSIELQAAINKFYGTSKQATQDYKNAVEKSGLKDIRNRFYEAMQTIYDQADEQGISPDYDLIERIQARYLQAVDNVLAPIIDTYGINILNNNDFLDAVRRQVNGMIPSDDWRQSTKNAKKFLSTKEFPTATVDVKKWLKQRYSSGMRDRGLDSDSEVTQRLEDIKATIDRGEKNSAKGKIESLRDGVSKASYYISPSDYQTLIEYYNMVK